MNNAGESYGVNGSSQQDGVEAGQRQRQGSMQRPGGGVGLPNGLEHNPQQQQQQQQHNQQQVQQQNGFRQNSQQQQQPVASGSSVRSASASPTKPSNKIRKRQKVEYDPVKRFYGDHPANWDAIQVEEVVTHASSKRQKRSARELGFCDIHTLKMSLRSRIGPEVAFALNSLGLLSATSDQQPSFAIGRHTELLEELVDFFEDALEGEDEFDDDDEVSSGHRSREASTSKLVSLGSTTSPTKAGTSKAGPSSRKREHQDSYNDTSNDAYADELKLRPVSSTSSVETFAGIDRAQVVLACLALFRNLSTAEHPTKPALIDPRLLTSILLATRAPQQVKELPEPPTRPLLLSPSQLLQARKDALQIIGNLGPNIHLEVHESWVGHAIVHLLDYFLEFGDSPASSTPAGLGLMNAFSANIDVALYALARIILTDANRDSFTKLPQYNTILRPFILSKFATLMQLLPLTDMDFAMINSEPALVRMEMVAMCLFNLIYIASPEVRKKLRESPGTMKVLVRIVRKLYGIHLATATQDQPTPNSLYLVLCQRCIEVLRILSEDEAVGSGQRTTGSQEGVAWFGSYSEGRDAGDSSGSATRNRPSLLFAKQDIVELLALPVSDRSIFSSLADCT